MRGGDGVLLLNLTRSYDLLRGAEALTPDKEQRIVDDLILAGCADTECWDEINNSVRLFARSAHWSADYSDDPKACVAPLTVSKNCSKKASTPTASWRVPILFRHVYLMRMPLPTCRRLQRSTWLPTQRRDANRPSHPTLTLIAIDWRLKVWCACSTPI